jgi:quercetin dioxygenase-like cupin family protein
MSSYARETRVRSGSLLEFRMIHSPPEFVDITEEMRARLARFREEHENDPLGGVGGTVLWEDDRVKIWELVLEPGESSDLHRHDHDYYLVIMEGDFVAGVSKNQGDVPFFVGKVPAKGNTVSIPKGATEWAYNVGEKTYREILVELK